MGSSPTRPTRSQDRRDVEPTTRSTYEGYVRNHIRRVLGPLPLAKLETETIESFYAQLRTCPCPTTACVAGGDLGSPTALI